MNGLAIVVEQKHRPVMVEEVLVGLDIQPNGHYVDATFGRGGHARAILTKLSPAGRLYVMDRDPEAIMAAELLQKEDPRVKIWQGSFSNLYAFCKEEGMIGKINGITLDLGVSSPQLDDSERGFSFLKDGPLDMRMDTNAALSAADWLNQAEETEIAQVLKIYGEERFNKRIARAIVLAREVSPITTTLQLAAIVAKANPAWEKHKNPATRSFQAIRIFINNELCELSTVLEQILDVLADNGRLVIISFHSLEDRIVKRFIQKHERGDQYPAGFPVTGSFFNQRLRHVNRKIKPSVEETEQNNRARSAILRVAEKVGNT